MEAAGGRGPRHSSASGAPRKEVGGLPEGTGGPSGALCGGRQASFGAHQRLPRTRSRPSLVARGLAF